MQYSSRITGTIQVKKVNVDLTQLRLNNHKDFNQLSANNDPFSIKERKPEFSKS
jgi:hypothetical protein